LAIGASAFAQGAPCFEPSLGASIGASDDSVSYNNALGFTFPGPGGVNYTAVDISSNGFLWLGTNPAHGDECCQGYVPGFLSEDARVAGVWEDLYPPGGAGVFFNAIPAGGGYPARAVITWNQVPEYGTSSLLTVQIQLVATGEIMINHAATNGPVQYSFHAPVVGVTQGGGASPNVVQFAAITPGGVNTGTNPTAYQQYSTPPNYDLAGRTLWFLPNGTGGYLVSQVCSPPPAASYTTYGSGCPLPPVVYEAFTANTCDLSNHSFLFTPNGVGGYQVAQGSGTFFNGFTNNIGAGDDTVTTVPIPFAFNHPAGSTNSLDVCSNGRVWLTPNPFGTSYVPLVSDFLNDPPCIAPLWADWYPPGAAAGGGVFADVDPSNSSFCVTWNNVPMYFNVGSNTMQLAIFSNGRFELRYHSVTNNATTGGDAIVGYSTGNGAVDPGNRDLTASVPFNTGVPGIPLTLAASPGSLPVLGTTFNQDITNIDVTSPLGAMVLGFTSFAPGGIDLGPLGAPTCFQWNSQGAVFLFFVTGNPTHTFGISIPSTTSLGGVHVFSQAATLTPGANALGVLTSNGGDMGLGI
ncbi:MAG TPA: hypothetical protein VK348_08270, partial [Planctomycetota bacterium]|nr:hypothetical protein [Planctomycetota bacterium]